MVTCLKSTQRTSLQTISVVAKLLLFALRAYSSITKSFEEFSNRFWDQAKLKQIQCFCFVAQRAVGKKPL